MDGKAFKASIGLVGLAGRFGLEMEGVERFETSTTELLVMFESEIT